MLSKCNQIYAAEASHSDCRGYDSMMQRLCTKAAEAMQFFPDDNTTLSKSRLGCGKKSRFPS